MFFFLGGMSLYPAALASFTKLGRTFPLHLHGRPQLSNQVLSMADGLYPLANLADGSSALQLCRGMILRARPKLPSEWVAEAWPITIY